LLYLTGSAPASPVEKAQLIDAGVGVLTSLLMSRSARPQAWDFPYWAADTGLFGESTRYDFDLGTYLRKLASMPKHSCLFATAPDVFGDGEATLKLSLDVLPQIRALGFPAAFVAQPGVPKYPWDEFDCLFMGGSDEFKQTEGQRLLKEAKHRSKWCHIGRVNSTKRYLWAREQGYDSADGTHIAFCPTKNVKRVLSWVTSSRQLTLEDIA
jgi:hypothetical protein